MVLASGLDGSFSHLPPPRRASPLMRRPTTPSPVSCTAYEIVATRLSSWRPRRRAPDTFEPAVAVAGAAINGAVSAGRRWLDADEVAAVLSAYGIPSARSRSVRDADGAAATAAEIGASVALKIRSPDLSHKSDVGGVVLNLATPAHVRAEAVAMLDRVRAARPQAQIDGQEMVARAGALELIVGLIDDSVFGPVICSARAARPWSCWPIRLSSYRR